MSPNYTELREKIEGIKERLNGCAKTLEGIEPEEMEKYENPQYRMWSGNIGDLEEFTDRLEEWLNQPRVAEAKRYLSDLKKWSESQEKISLEEIEKDWNFLSDNVEEIKGIHKQIGDIGYESIKEKTSTWVLRRIIEKDIERAKIWAFNANKFTNALKQLEDKKVESNLAEEVKKDAVDELLKVTSFDEDEEKIIRYQELIDKAENMVKNKPEEIGEKAMIKTYRVKKKDMEIEEDLSTLSKVIEEIKNHLINLEWVEEITNFKDYNSVWKEKQSATKKNDAEDISNALGVVVQKANKWKDSTKKRINNSLSRAERMAKNIEREDFKKKFISLRGQAEVINWDKPDVESLHNIVSQIDTLRKQLREELTKKLQNEDAISIIEEPEIIEDLGQKNGWDFDRFFKALEVILRSGIIEIRMAEEK
jgi:hypothetical protein